MLDTMDLERERGITIKAHPVRLHYTAAGRPAVRAEPDRHARARRLLLRGDPLAGGVRGRAAAGRRVAGRRGADAGQRVPGGRAATSTIIPVINKIDLPGAQPEETRRQIEDIIGLDGSGAILASAKEGTGTPEILEAIVKRVPPPRGDPDAPLKALIFDSSYDPYRGVVIVVRIIDGTMRPGMKIRLMADGQDYEVEQVGTFTPKPTVAEASASARSGSWWRTSRA